MDQQETPGVAGIPIVSHDHVLVVEDDQECLEEYLELIEGLGYRCTGCSDPSQALRIIAGDPRIGIVVTDLQMPLIDGLTLLDELAARFMDGRPLVALLVTGHASLETAVRAMRSSAVDLLCKPVSNAELSAALRRASKRCARLAIQMRIRALSEMVEPVQVSRPALAGAAVPTPAQLQSVLQSIMARRRKRFDFLDPALFFDPAWDILLELTSAALDSKSVPVSSACAAAAVPFSTALRHVRQLVDYGLVRRWQDPLDKRRTLLVLEQETLDSMRAYLASVWVRQNS